CRVEPPRAALPAKSVEAQRANAQASGREVIEQVGGAAGTLAAALGSVQQADARVSEGQGKIELARKRVVDNRELVRTGAGDRFTLEAAETDLKSLEAQLDS